MAQDMEDVTARDGGTATSGDSDNAMAQNIVGAGAPEEPVDESEAIDFSGEIEELKLDIAEFADQDPVPPEYWDAVTRLELVEFMDFWVNGNDSTVALAAEIIGIDGKYVSEYFSDILDSEDLLAQNSADFLEIQDSLSEVRATVENNIADKILGIPIPNPAGLGKWLFRKAAGAQARRAVRGRIRRQTQERIKRRQRRRRQRCRANRATPSSSTRVPSPMPTRPSACPGSSSFISPARTKAI